MPRYKFPKGNPGKPKGAVSEKRKMWDEIGEAYRNELMPIYYTNLIAMMRSADPKIKEEGMKRMEASFEYFQPKLSRSELVGDKGKDLFQGMDEEKAKSILNSYGKA